MIPVRCSHCGKELKAKEELAGKKVKCPGCRKAVAVPRAAAPFVLGGKGQESPDPHEKGTLPPRTPPGTEEPTLPPKNRDRIEKESVSEAPGQTDLGGGKMGETTQGSPAEAPDPELIDFLAPAQSAAELGRLGGFRILKILGHGGMGVVFQGEDPRLGRKVAIKAMLPHLAGSKSSQERFLREARAAAALEHDHIVPILQVGEDRGAPFIVMPYLKGETLDHRLQREPVLPVAEVLRIGREIARGLGVAHAAGLIHRDIKPANIWLEELSDRVKILDFGLARVSAGESGLTQQGTIIGTPAYMAPEQGAGEKIDHRCDLFSLGCVLYRLCTGQMPFKGKDTVALLVAVAMDQPPTPAEINPEVPEALSHLIMRLLAKKPKERPESAGAVAAVLEVIERQEGAAPPRPARRQPAVKKETAKAPGGGTMPGRKEAPHSAVREGKLTVLAKPQPDTGQAVPPERWRHLLHSRAFWVGTTLVLALVLVLYRFTPTAILIVTNQGEVVVQTDRNVVIILKQGGQEVRQLTADAARNFWIPAGTYQADIVIRDPDTGKELSRFSKTVTVSRGARLDLDIPREVQLARLESAGDLNPSQIPEEDRVSWQKEVVAVLGTHRQRHWSAVYKVVISPDGKWVASTGLYDRMHLWEVAETEILERSPPRVGGFGPQQDVAFSPDSKTLATGERLWDLTAGPEVREGPPTVCGGNSVAYSPDGKMLALGLNKKVVLWDQADPAALGQTELKGPQSGVLAVAIGGKFVAAASRDQEKAIRVWDLSGAEPNQCEPPALPAKTQVHTLAMSADGKFLAAGIVGGLIRLWRLDGTKTTALPSIRYACDPSSYCFVTFTSDGKTLASLANAEIRFWTVTAMGLQLKGSLPGLSPGHRPVSLALRGDGQVMATGGWDGTVRLWDLAQSTPKELFPIRGPRGEVRAVVFTPDSKGVAVVTLDHTRLWKLDGPRPREHALLPPAAVGSVVDFTPDGSQVVTNTPNGVAVWRTADPRKPLAVLEGQWCTLSPKGPFLVVTGVDDKSGWISLYRLAGAAPPSLVQKLPVPFPTNFCTISPDGCTLAAGTAAGTGPNIFLYALGEGQLRPGPVIKGQGGLCVFSPDSRTLVSGGWTTPAKIWNLNGKQLFEGFSNMALGLAFSPDGKILAMACRDRVLLWDYAARRKLRDLEYPGYVSRVAFSPNGRYLATGNGNGTVYIFRMDKLLEKSAK